LQAAAQGHKFVAGLFAKNEHEAFLVGCLYWHLLFNWRLT